MLIEQSTPTRYAKCHTYTGDNMSLPKDYNTQVAYFSAEYGLQTELPIYAGGLGVLSGDTIKEAADQEINMVAVGLLYRGIKAVQSVDESGWQTEQDADFDPVSCGIEHVYQIDEEQPQFIKITIGEEDIWLRAWKKQIKNLTLYLLDTDTDQNQPQDRHITHALYYGSEEDIIKQQLILGIGGVRLLNELGIKPHLYHVNEGRPAFLYFQVIQDLMKTGLSYSESSQLAKQRIVYTNHTLVKAGNQSYNTDLLKQYLVPTAQQLGTSVDDMLTLGNDNNSGGAFSVTQLALNTSCRASAVSQIHYNLSKDLWPDYNWSGITNGVHMPTWQDSDIAFNYEDAGKLWHTHQDKKRQLMEFVQQVTGYGYNPDWLVISWARRIASYKRPDSLFADIQRLKKLITSQDKPAMILMAGKAHALDTAAKQMLQTMIIAMQTELTGHALYIPNYNLDVASHLVKGSDIWVNTPVFGKEASGTSGMKAVANGVLQLTVEDGWANEVDWKGTGWALDSEKVSESFYSQLEQDIVPMFYNRNQDNIPVDWVTRMQRSIKLAEKFSTTRMLNEYKQKLYKID